MRPSAAYSAGVRAGKAVKLVSKPAYWPALLRGVAAAVEHTKVDFRDDVGTVFDVGASRGQFAVFALHRFPEARVVCFEPLPAAQETLRKLLPPARTTVHPIALGRDRSRLDLHVSARDDSSSLLPIGDGQLNAFPGTQETRRVQVRVGVLEDFLIPDPPKLTLLKIDVQGYELAVLQGAGNRLDLVAEVIVECSFVELYTGQPMADAVVCHLRAAGFTLVGVYGVARTTRGTCLQADLLFRRL